MKPWWTFTAADVICYVIAAVAIAWAFGPITTVIGWAFFPVGILATRYLIWRVWGRE